MLPTPFFDGTADEQLTALQNMPDTIWLTPDHTLATFMTALIPHLPDETIDIITTAEDTLITFSGTDHHTPLTPQDTDPHLILRWLQDILGDQYELRIFRLTHNHDQWATIVKPFFWWKSIERRYPSYVDGWFITLDELLAED
ncbi:MAG TPA: hypothetical protein VLL52_25740 [Anaerolineae bacterium]|nr:hypothetical protein [Anaerolineae bacterium]